MSWLKNRKTRQLDLDFELARHFVADLFTSTQRWEELNRLIRLLSLPGVNLYYKGNFVSPKRLALIAREVAGGIVTIAVNG